MTTRILTGALVLAALAAPSAQAARWSRPYRLPFGPSYVAGFAVADDGRAAIVGANADETGGGEGRPRVVVAVPNRGTVTTNLAAAGLDFPQVAIAGHDRLALAWTTGGQAPQVRAAGGALASPPRSGQVLSATCDGCAAAEVAQVERADGTTLVAWIDQAGSVRYAVLAPGATLPERTGMLAGSGGGSHALSLGLDGSDRVIATWISGGELTTRTGTMAGDFGAPSTQVVGGGLETTDQGPIVVDTDRAGDQYAFWRVGGPGGPVELRSAYRAAGGAFGAPRTVARVNERRAVSLQWDFAAGPAGQAGLAYALVPSRRGAHDVVRVRLARAGGSWGAARSLGARRRYAAAPKIGIDARGRALVIWADQRGAGRGVSDVLSATSRRFGRPVRLPEPPGRRDCASPQLRVAASGRAAAWVQCTGFAQELLLYRP
jgi:hypothetical protein